MSLINASLPPDVEAVKLGASRIRGLESFLNSLLGILWNDDTTFKTDVLPGATLVDHSVTTQQLDTSTVITLLQVPTGVMLEYAGTTVPNSNYLLCDGAAVSRTTYANLFAVIGTTYGAGNGTTTFNVPDSRGRVTAGADNFGTGAAGRLTVDGTFLPSIAVGGVGGEQDHTLATGEIPAHTHPISNVVAQSAGTFAGGGFTGATIQNINTGNNSPAGGAHNNMQPTLLATKIIRI